MEELVSKMAKTKRLMYLTVGTSLTLIAMITPILFFLWKDIYVKEFNIPKFLAYLLM